MKGQPCTQKPGHFCQTYSGCDNCGITESTKVLWRREHILGFDIAQIEQRPDGAKVLITLDDSGWHRYEYDLH